jgi:hypothetical protein
MEDPNENGKRAFRIEARFETLYSAGREEGSGILVNISYSGALLESASLSPKLGSDIRIHVFYRREAPIEAIGRVVRHAGNGFAVEFADPDPKVRDLVDALTPLVDAEDLTEAPALESGDT